jgi:hypothetical protein
MPGTLALTMMALYVPTMVSVVEQAEKVGDKGI